MIATAELDVVTAVRRHFPVLSREVNGYPLVYFDNAASMQMPEPVVQRLVRYQHAEHANIHRGVHTMSYEATMAYEAVRESVRAAFAVPDSHEVLFMSGTTQAINTVAFGLRDRLRPGDVVLLTHMEHHANIVPWQMAAQAAGARLEAVEVLENGTLDLEDFYRKLRPNVKVVAFTAISNVSGVINPVPDIVSAAHANGSLVLVDGAQAAAHFFPVFPVAEPDFFTFSAHKFGGPTGCGVLIARRDLLESMEPMLGGGDMIRTVDIEKSSWADVPHKFEAGTPNISGVIGMGEALHFWSGFDRELLQQQEDQVAGLLRAELQRIRGIRFIGHDAPQVSTVSFVIDALHPHDAGTFLDQEGIAVRTGHHCAQPLMKRFGIPGTIRASIAPYNTIQEAERFLEALNRTILLLKG